MCRLIVLLFKGWRRYRCGIAGVGSICGILVGILLQDGLGAGLPLTGAEDALGVLGIDDLSLLQQVGQGVMPALVLGQNLTGTMGKKSKKLRYHCDSCGYEKTY